MDERVLLVEDDASIREVTALGLQRSGFRVTTAADGRDGLTQGRQDVFDIVVLDVMLPGLDGFEVCREIRKVSRVPILMLTARTDTVDVVVGLESGADDYVKKPFEVAELVARVRALLRRAAAPVEETAISVGVLQVDPGRFVAWKAGVELALTATAAACQGRGRPRQSPADQDGSRRRLQARPGLRPACFAGQLPPGVSAAG